MFIFIYLEGVMTQGEIKRERGGEWDEARMRSFRLRLALTWVWSTAPQALPVVSQMCSKGLASELESTPFYEFLSQLINFNRKTCWESGWIYEPSRGKWLREHL